MDKLFEVRRQYLEVLAAEAAESIAAESRTVAAELLDLATAQQDAGAGNAVDVNSARSELLQSEVLARRASMRVLEARARLIKLLGISAHSHEIGLIDELPQAPKRIPPVENLQAFAETNRLDLLAAQEAVNVAASLVKLQNRMFVRVVEAGGEYEREPRGAGESSEISAGPALSVELPVFDQNQAQLARAEFEYMIAEKRLEGLRISIRQDVSVANQRMTKLWDLVAFYQESLLPQQESSLQLAGDAYRLGEVSFVSVLEAQKQFLTTREQHLSTLLEASTATVELEQVTGQHFAEVRGE